MPQDGQAMNVTGKKLPTPSRTEESPRGLISDYIRLVDQLSLKARKV
jgi:hypothetical protein